MDLTLQANRSPVRGTKAGEQHQELQGGWGVGSSVLFALPPPGAARVEDRIYRSELGHVVVVVVVGGGGVLFGRARREKVVNQQQELKYSAATKYFTVAAKAARDTGHRVTAETRPDRHGRSAHGKNHTPHKQNTSWCGCCAASSQWREESSNQSTRLNPRAAGGATESFGQGRRILLQSISYRRVR